MFLGLLVTISSKLISWISRQQTVNLLSLKTRPQNSCALHIMRSNSLICNIWDIDVERLRFVFIY